jgi:beta-fructofuranosidase
MFDLTDQWVWDFWLAEDATGCHLFFLKAPRSLGDPELRHLHASVGHAVSTDLVSWTRVPDALDPAPAAAFDDLAIWTGSVVRGDDGIWRMFHTGIARAEDGRVQRIGLATSSDLVTWDRRTGPSYPLSADRRWYEDAGAGTWPDESWRDPWVVRDDDGTWHMYVTARARGGGAGAGVVGHAVSTDLDHWQVQPALSVTTGRFDWLEVIQVVCVEGRWVAVFSCLADHMPGMPAGSGGIWSVPVAGPGSPVDVTAATRLTGEDLYVGKLVRQRDGRWCLLAFRNTDAEGRFVGGVTDPLPVRWELDRIVLEPFSTTG